jgi:hypothetical protein
MNRPGRGAFEPGDNRHHRRFAGTGRADVADGLALAHRQVEAAQNIDGTGGALQRQVDIAQIEQGFTGGIAGGLGFTGGIAGGTVRRHEHSCA